MEYDRTLKRADIIEMLGLSPWEADKFMSAFGHRTGHHSYRVISQREFQFLRLEGKLGEWVKNNCAENRQTISQRKGEA